MIFWCAIAPPLVFTLIYCILGGCNDSIKYGNKNELLRRFYEGNDNNLKKLITEDYLYTVFDGVIAPAKNRID